MGFLGAAVLWWQACVSPVRAAPVNEIAKLVWVYSPKADSNFNFSKLDATELLAAAKAKGLTIQFLNADRILPGQPLEARQAALKSTLKGLVEHENAFVLIRTHGNIDGLPRTGKKDTKLAFFTDEGFDIPYSAIAAVLDPQVKVKGIAVDACHSSNDHLTESGKKVPGRISCASVDNEYGQGPEKSQVLVNVLARLIREPEPAPLGKQASEIYGREIDLYNRRFGTHETPKLAYGEDQPAIFRGKQAALVDAEGHAVSTCVSPFGRKLFPPDMLFSGHDLDPAVNGFEHASRRQELVGFGDPLSPTLLFRCERTGRWRAEPASYLSRRPVGSVGWKNCLQVIKNLDAHNRDALKKVPFDRDRLTKECAVWTQRQRWLETQGMTLSPDYERALAVPMIGNCENDKGDMLVEFAPRETVQAPQCCPSPTDGGSAKWDATAQRCDYVCVNEAGKSVPDGACFSPRSVAGSELTAYLPDLQRCEPGKWPWAADKECCAKQGGELNEWGTCRPKASTPEAAAPTH